MIPSHHHEKSSYINPRLRIISSPLPSGKHSQFAIESGPVEIVDLPFLKMVIFHSFWYVYQRVIPCFRLITMSSWPYEWLSGTGRTDGCCWLEWCIRIWSSTWADDWFKKWSLWSLFLGANVGRASGNDCYIVIEHGPWKIVDLPIKDGDFP